MKANSDLSVLRSTLKVLSEETRIRILSLMKETELKVNEIQTILKLKQSTLSVHLKLLKDYGLVSHRREGKNIFYQMTQTKNLTHSKETVVSVLNVAKSANWYELDQRKLKSILETRTKDSIEFFDKQKTNHYPINLMQVWLQGFLGLVENKKIIDLGCGEGALMSFLVQAGKKNEIYGLDNSTQQLKLAKKKISNISEQQKLNIDYTHLINGDMENTKFTNNFFDLAIISNSLHHTSHPVKVIEETFRILKNGGDLIIYDLNQHDYEDIQMKYGDFWMGFNQEKLTSWLTEAGFQVNQYHILKNNLDEKIDPIVVLTKKPRNT